MPSDLMPTPMFTDECAVLMPNTAYDELMFKTAYEVLMSKTRGIRLLYVPSDDGCERCLRLLVDTSRYVYIHVEFLVLIWFHVHSCGEFVWNFLSVGRSSVRGIIRSAVGKNIVGELCQHNTVCDSGTNQFKRGSIVGTFAGNKGTLN